MSTMQQYCLDLILFYMMPALLDMPPFDGIPTIQHKHLDILFDLIWIHICSIVGITRCNTCFFRLCCITIVAVWLALPILTARIAAMILTHSITHTKRTAVSAEIFGCRRCHDRD
ncbi:MAG: hypothetical protein KAT13_06030 [Methanosarcinales archaeon]|nr:hypothetical protein [Methanosarcinales archaeon]